MTVSEDYENGYRAGKNGDTQTQHQATLKRLNGKRKAEWLKGFMKGMMEAQK